MNGFPYYSFGPGNVVPSNAIFLYLNCSVQLLLVPARKMRGQQNRNFYFPFDHRHDFVTQNQSESFEILKRKKIQVRISMREYVQRETYLQF